MKKSSKNVSNANGNSSTEQYKHILEVAHEAIVIHTDGKIVYANPQAIRLSRAESMADLIGKPIFEFIHPDHKDAAIRRIQKLKKGETIPPIIKTVYVNLDGSTVPVEVSGARTTFNGKPSIQIFIRDISDRLQQQEALVKSEQKWRELFENMLDGWFAYDNDGKFTEANQAFLDMLGYSITELCQKTQREITPEKWHSFEENIVAKTLHQKGSTGIYEKEFLCKDGRTLPVELSVHLIKDEDGQPIGTWGIAHNIAQLKASQDALAVSEFLNQITLENISDAIFITDDDGKFTFISTDPKPLFGYSRDDLLKMGNISKLFNVGKIDASFLRSKGEIQNIEYEITDKAGNQKFILVNIKNVIIGTGTRLFTCHDITDRKRVEIALQQSEKRYRLLFDTSPVGIITMDHQGNVQEVNQEMLNLLGSPSREMTRQINMLTFPPLVESGISKSLQECLDTGDSFFCEHPYASKWGKETLFHYHLAPIRNNQGEIKGVLCVALDYTERRQAEETVRENERFLQNIFDAIQDGISVLDPDLTIVKTNQWIMNQYAHNKPLAGKKCYAAYQERDSVCPWCPSIKALRSGKAHTHEAPYPNEKNPEGWIDLSAFPIKNIEGKVTGVIEYVKDISERKNAEKALQESEKQYRQLIDGMNETVWIIDFDGNLIDVNRRAIEELGYSKEELLSIGLYGIDSSLKREDIKALAASMPADKLQIFETTHKTKAGKSFPVEIYSSLVTYHGKPAIISIARNITERKQAEKELKQKMSELERFNRLMVGRENRMIELKKEVDELRKKLDLPKKYKGPENSV